MISYTTFQLAVELVGAIFTLFCAGAMLIEKKVFPRRSTLLALLLFADTALLISDAIALGFRGNPTTLAFYLVRISNFIVFALMPVMIILVYYFIQDIIQANGGLVSSVWAKLLHALCICHLLVLIISQFTGFIYYFDQSNTYHRSPAFPVMTVFGLLELCILAGIVLKHRKQIRSSIRIILLIYICMPIISAIIQTLYYGIALNNIAATIALLLLFLTFEVSKSSHHYSQMERLMEQEMALKDKELILSNQEKELVEARLQLSLSQMQPHFMFNTLGSIEQLCKIDSKRAVEATHYFSQYLRNNLLAMNSSALKPFSEELNHIHAYIWLEKMRFGDDLEYTEEIEVSSNFMLPLLSLQPIIENRINLGMRIQEEGVIHIDLRTYEDETDYHVVVSDNLEEDLAESDPEDNFEATILANIKEHIQLMCHGKATMTKSEEKGTIFHIQLPKM